LRRTDLLIILAAVLLLRLPFLNEAVQGDDTLFLTSAAHALIDPLHPNHTHYVFSFVGQKIDFRAYPHPLINQWVLAGLIAIFGSVKEVPFHAAYILFSLLAAFAMYSLARRFSPRPLWATLLFLVVPAFAVNGASFESDVPHVAFFLAGIAAFVVFERYWVAAIFLALASLTAVQAVVATPILLVYLWLNGGGAEAPRQPKGRPTKHAIITAFSPMIALTAWETFERITGGVFPFLATAGYVRQEGWDAISKHLRSAAGLTIHLWFLIFPLLFAAGIYAAWKQRDRDKVFLAAWIVIYLAAAFVLFFSGSARYLLPVAAPVAIIGSFARRSWVMAGFGVQLVISIGLAIANYEQWSAYREFSKDLAAQTGGRRVWVNSEWGLRHYLEDAGARVPLGHQVIPAGDVVVWSELAFPVPVAHSGSMIAPLLQRDVRPRVPFRIIALDSHSGYSSIDKGFLPYGIAGGLVDRIHADAYKEVKPTLSDLPMNAPEADGQIISGIFDLEDGKQRWSSGAASVVLVSPAAPEPLHADFYLPDNAPARQARLLLDGKVVLVKTLPGPGTHRIVSEPVKGAGPTGIVTLELDKTFSAPGDSRKLGVVLLDLGWGK
jgi:hypothetical protein